eukprot:14620-Heterococcus_DN1.PRE.6
MMCWDDALIEGIRENDPAKSERIDLIVYDTSAAALCGCNAVTIKAAAQLTVDSECSFSTSQYTIVMAFCKQFSVQYMAQNLNKNKCITSFLLYVGTRCQQYSRSASMQIWVMLVFLCACLHVFCSTQACGNMMHLRQLRSSVQKCCALACLCVSSVMKQAADMMITIAEWLTLTVLPAFHVSIRPWQQESLYADAACHVDVQCWCIHRRTSLNSKAQVTQVDPMYILMQDVKNHSAYTQFISAVCHGTCHVCAARSRGSSARLCAASCHTEYKCVDQPQAEQWYDFVLRVCALCLKLIVAYSIPLLASSTADKNHNIRSIEQE